MESYGTPILEEYSLMLKALPYYSFTHNALLLLSSFSQKSRKILNKSYKAFLNCMEKNLIQVEIYNENIKRRYSLPCDLFKFNITIENEGQATYFKKWIVSISKGYGFYVISNSFHRISLTELKIQEDLLEGFRPYIEIMKSIIIHNGENDQSLLDIASVSSNDHVFDLKNITNFLNNCVNIPNPITKFFNKINDVILDGDYSKMIECLEAMKKVTLYFKCISICPNNAEELENLTDPNLHNTQINNLRLMLGSINFSSKTIENLKKIYPNLITLYFHPFHKDETAYKSFFGNFTKLLSNLDQTSLEMDFDGLFFKFRLEFNDVIFKVVESKKEYSYIRAKSVEISCKGEEFCWIK